MKFLTDKQTLDDLDILNRYSSSSIFSFFNQTVSSGGDLLLEEMFKNPLTDYELINERAGMFSYFSRLNAVFPVTALEFGVIEKFLQMAEQKNWFGLFGEHLRRKSLSLLGLREEFTLFEDGIRTTATVFQKLNGLLHTLPEGGSENPFRTRQTLFQEIYDSHDFRVIRELAPGEPLDFFKTLKIGYLLGVKFHGALLTLLRLAYELDVFIAVGNVADKNGFVFARAHSADGYSLTLKNCRYPVLKNAKGNDITIDKRQNIFFLTGANMAGKSTLMKSVGCAVYLAHMGFPVAADAMEFSVKDGIFTSINVPDNISRGYSHFYAEVLRVKTIAAEVAGQKNLMVIFDELFKGTNVKDAFDATLAVTEGLCPYINCAFIISTHILEVATELMGKEKGIFFAYMPTIMQGNVPKYTYELTPGVSADRHGMLIIGNEGILEMLSNKKNTEQTNNNLNL